MYYIEFRRKNKDNEYTFHLAYKGFTYTKSLNRFYQLCKSNKEQIFFTFSSKFDFTTIAIYKYNN